MFAEPAATPTSADNPTQQLQSSIMPTQTPPWEVVLQLGLQTLHGWQSEPEPISLNKLPLRHLTALLYLASLPSTPESLCNSSQADTSHSDDVQTSLSQQQNLLAELFDELRSDLTGAANSLAIQPSAKWIFWHVTQQMMLSGQPSSLHSDSSSTAVKQMKIAAHFLLQYTQRPQPADGSERDDGDLTMMLWAHLIAGLSAAPARLSETKLLQHFNAPR